MEFVRRNVNKASGTSSGSGNSGGFSNTATSTSIQPHTIFSQLYDGTNDVRGDLADVQNITANGDVSLDGDLIIKGIDEEGAYNDKDVTISKEAESTTFTGGEEYIFDADVVAPKFKGNVEANLVDSVTTYADYLLAREGTIDDLESAKAYIKELLADNITVDTLTVTKAAHFFSLIIDEIKSVGGQIILSPANATLDMVKTTSTGNYKCYFRAQIGDEKISNQFVASDLVVCQTFNVAEGTTYNASNKFYWRRITSRGKETVEGTDYHYIILSGTDCAEGSGVPEEGDKVVTLGNALSSNKDRQNAIILSAYNSEFLDKGLKAPSIVQYSGINDYQLTTHRLNIISNGLNEFRGNFKVTTGESVTDLIDGVKYDRIILDQATAIVDSNDIMTFTVNGTVLPISDESYYMYVSDNIGWGVGLAVRNNAFSYSKTIKNFSYTATKPSFYCVYLQQGDTIIDKVNIPIQFEAGAVLQVLDDAIEAVVTDVEGDISRVEQKADSITATVQNMKVGGVNLLDDSEFKTFDGGTTLSIWDEQNGVYGKNLGYMDQIGIRGTSKPSNVTEGGYSNLARQKLTYKLQPDTYYTFSFYAKGVSTTSTDQGQTYKYKARVCTYVYPNVGSEVSDNRKDFTLTSDWKRYQYTFKTKSNLDTSGEYYALFRLWYMEDGFYSNASICMPKLEEGTMATAWDNSTTDIKSQITQTASSIEAKIVSEDKIKSMISQDKDTIKAEVYDEMNRATGINVTNGSITLNADKTTIKGNLNITDTQNGITVFETATYNGQSTLIPRINLQPKQIADITDMAQDTYSFFSKPIYQTNNNNWSLDFGSNDYQCNKDDTVTLDTFYLREMRSDSSGTQNPPYSSTCKLIIKMYLVSGGTATEWDRKEYTLTKQDNYGVYRSTDIARFAIPKDGTYRFSVASSFSQTAVTSYPIMNAMLSIRIQKASRATTYVGTDGMYCHSGANKCLYVNEKETVIQHGFNGIKWDNSDVNGNRSMKVVTGITGSIPNLKPVWYPFYNFTPMYKPTNPTATTKIVNDGNSYSRYAYKINPLKDTGICYMESAFMDSSLNYVESWILLPPSYWYDEEGTLHQLPVGYTVEVINGGFGNSKFNAYVSADVSKSHQAVFIDGHRDKNWKVSLNGEVHWEKFVFVGSYYSSDCSDNQDIWMTFGDAQ